MVLAALQKLNKVIDDRLVLFSPHPWPSKARWPSLLHAHPCSGDVFSCSFEVEVVCHHGNWREVGDEGLDVLKPRRDGEQESVTCLPDPLP